jgi:hypothetical protein
MDVALLIFNVGAGLGVLAAGLAIAYLAWSTAPLIRESRALAADLRRLARTVETDLPPLVAQAREVVANAEVLSEDAAVRLERLGNVLTVLDEAVDRRREMPGPRRPESWPVESSETREERWGS